MATAVRLPHRAGGLISAGIAPPPPQLRTKGNSGIIKGGCAERKLSTLPSVVFQDRFGSMAAKRRPSRLICFMRGVMRIPSNSDRIPA